ncbi:FAD-dependent pyridine nucleotide-disulfide oxidoreductase [Rhizobium sp. Root1204]|nr:FAD-dependent pyridine nucleotide-disulfide oxidoreductase [Rhizobium sp. Root1204]
MWLVYDIVVVGSGFSAIAVTINLLQLLPASSSIAIIGDNRGFGRGTAYRTEFHLHRLNVPAGRMSVFPDKPNDFLMWLEAKGKGKSGDDFASRGDYGLYLRDTLASLLRGHDRAKVSFIKAKATGCVEQYRVGTVFQLDNAAELIAQTVVFCLGVGSAQLPVSPEGLAAGAKRHIIKNPWRLNWLLRVGERDRVCVLGSGLTMIDQVLALRARGHRGEIRVLSRRGLVPHPHHSHRVSPIKPALPAGQRQISAILGALRRQIREGADWRAVMDGLRPDTQALWQELSREQRARFLRHALPWWNIHRHRISPTVFEGFDSLIKNGTVKLHAGFVKSILDSQNGVAVTYRPRLCDRSASFETDWIVNCTGMERAGVNHSPLLKEMLKTGMISADALGLGIAIDTESRVLDSNGQAQSRMFAVGALSAGQFWEITAVPDIRVQAKLVAAAISSCPTLAV